MKTSILVSLLFGFGGIYAQDTIGIQAIDSVAQHSKIFSLSPISKKVDQVNGLVFGLGHINNKNIERQTINGINIEANPAPAAGVLYAFMMLMHIDDVIKNNKIKVIKNSEEDYKIRNVNYTPDLKLNGLNLSSGCFFTTTSMNGLNISAGNKFNDFNGFSVTILGTIADNQNGLSIGVYNANNDLIGSTIGVYNQSYELKGLHLGVFNQAQINRGLQIGVFNKSNSKGFQLGLWNINNKRSMPFLNW
ncbi:LA_2272 family surface repeat-containing protein [Flavobacterium sp. PS2]|uniref:LA_2272 family surface repeat-containing protein n=1 Tax=Flavobacterium sp. PS2 TaxID=3384157 RepID=UPI00390C8669